jgi:hypothetical protein
MPKGLQDTERASIEQRLDIIIALLSQLVVSTAGDTPLAQILIDAGAANDQVAKLTGMSYGSVANLRSKKKKNKPGSRTKK